MPRKASSKPKEHLTSTTVGQLPIPASGQRFYYDQELSGFAVRVTANGTRAFVVDCFKRGKRIRYTIGKCELYSVIEARNQARVLLGKIQTGENPHAMRREKMARAVTLEETFDTFLEARKNLAARTVYDYRRLMNTHLAKWKNKALVDITKDMIERRHAELGVNSGNAQANYTMRFVRAVFNFAMVKYESSNGEAMIAVNPVKRLSQMRAWYHIDRRTSYIKPHQLKPWFEAVLDLSHTRRDRLPRNGARLPDFSSADRTAPRRRRAIEVGAGRSPGAQLYGAGHQESATAHLAAVGLPPRNVGQAQGRGSERVRVSWGSGRPPDRAQAADGKSDCTIGRAVCAARSAADLCDSGQQSRTNPFLLQHQAAAEPQDAGCDRRLHPGRRRKLARVHATGDRLHPEGGGRESDGGGDRVRRDRLRDSIGIP